MQSRCILFKFQLHQRFHLLLSTVLKEKCLSTTAMVFLEEIYLKHMQLDLKSADFVVGKRLNTTNTMRLGIVMLSWQPRLGLLICCFIYSVGLKSKQHGEIFSCTVLRKSAFTNHRGKERSCSVMILARNDINQN